MKAFNKFYFESFNFDKETLKASFLYSFDKNINFEEIIDFSSDDFSVIKNIDINIVNNILSHLHIALWISYYKSFPTKELIMESCFLDEEQIKFWKKFYVNWLWEFLYTNKISPNLLFNFVNNWWKKYEKINFEISEKALVPVWWWKDSIVSIELLKNAWIDIDLFTFAVKDNLLYENTSNISWNKRLWVKRKISNELVKMVDEWYYNWHVPITWLIAFIMEAVAYLYNYKYLVLSNEKSANFWNTNWEWIKINHQYSKSLEFEKDFRKYTNKYINSEVYYFSLLRWLYEIKIAELFWKYWKQYFWSFSSCNQNFKIFSEKTINQKKWKYWCNQCPKCAFVFSIIRPFVSDNEMLEIFWEDLYDKKELELLFRELLWISWIKPFECVWEASEVILSMKKSLDLYLKENLELPYILNIFKEEIDLNMSNNNYTLLEEKLYNISNNDIIPNLIKNKIKYK